MDPQWNGGEILRYRDGEVIVREGQQGSHLYFVLAGGVQIRKEGSQFASGLGKCEVGETFGEMSLVDSHPRSATAIAVGDTEVVCYDRAGFFEAIRQEPEMAVRVIASLSGKLRKTDEDLQKVRAAYLRSRTEST